MKAVITPAQISICHFTSKKALVVMAFYQPLTNVIPRRQMAELYIKLGREISYGESGDGSKQEATAVFRQALQIDSENADAQDALKNLIVE
ncbi:hypothetical protein [Nostoc sp.]|uniref:hypothetical protein n=1 Tax=Nostoc sp. TaxID=1180 RepID=UPI002FFCB11E